MGGNTRASWGEATPGRDENELVLCTRLKRWNWPDGRQENFYAELEGGCWRPLVVEGWTADIYAGKETKEIGMVAARLLSKWGTIHHGKPAAAI